MMYTTTKIPPADMMFSRNVKFAIPIDNKVTKDNINKELKNHISQNLNFTRKSVITSDTMQRISLYELEIELCLN